MLPEGPGRSSNSNSFKLHHNFEDDRSKYSDDVLNAEVSSSRYRQETGIPRFLKDMSYVIGYHSQVEATGTRGTDSFDSASAKGIP